MIVSKNNLMVYDIGTSSDKKMPILANLHITEDGDTVVCNGKTVLLVEGVEPERAAEIPFAGKGPDRETAVTLPLDYVASLVRATPKDKQFGGLLELIRIEEGRKEGIVQAVLHDGKGEKVSKRQEFGRKFIDFKGILKERFFSKKVKSSFILERSRLIKTLQGFDKICGDSPCFIEVTEDNDLFIRSIIPETGQRVMALVTGVVSEWLPAGRFEKKFSGEEEKKKKVKRSPRHKCSVCGGRMKLDKEDSTLNCVKCERVEPYKGETKSKEKEGVRKRKKNRRNR